MFYILFPAPQSPNAHDQILCFVFVLAFVFICVFFLCVYLFWAYSMCICPHKNSPAAYLLYQIYDYLSLSICLRKRNKCCSGRCTWAVVIVFCRCPWFSASFCLCLCLFVCDYLFLCKKLKLQWPMSVGSCHCSLSLSLI